MTEKLSLASADRNKGPILEVLTRVIPPNARILEIASGTGQHAVHFAAHLPGITWQPSDIDPERRASIRIWREESGLENILKPLAVDVTESDWGVGIFDAIYNSNLIHISPWECSLGLLAGARRHVRPGGLLIIYGPFKIGGEHTAPSNLEFDESLRSRDPAWGVRDLEAVREAADGFELEERVGMPANNRTLVFRRT
jgi:SAM-dependent methyltransferase